MRARGTDNNLRWCRVVQRRFVNVVDVWARGGEGPRKGTPLSAMEDDETMGWSLDGERKGARSGEARVRAACDGVRVRLRGCEQACVAQSSRGGER